MIREVRYLNWKSFGDALLPLEALTVLIGANASGKSNALDGLEFLRRAAEGRELRIALEGDVSTPGLRGGREWAPRRPHTDFALEVLVGSSDEAVDYQYRLSVATEPRVEVKEETLTRVTYQGSRKYELRLFWTDPAQPDAVGHTIRLYNRKAGTRRECRRSSSVLSQLSGSRLRAEIERGVDTLVSTLRSIFVLDPIPSRMRSYSQVTDQLSPDGATAAGVLAALDGEAQQALERRVTKYVSRLPERDIERVWAERVGKFKTDAMLYCEESWGSNGDTTTVDARGLSDGTLRFVAILLALLTRPRGSQLIIEEVDNGVYPSRARLLLEMLQHEGKARGVDVLVTTHNPALLDALPPNLVPNVNLAHRSSTGLSRFTPLAELELLPKLLSTHGLGGAVISGRLEKDVKMSLSGA